MCGQAFSKVMTRLPIPSPHVDPHSAEKKGGQRDMAPPEAVRLQALGCPILPSHTSVGSEPTPEKKGPVSPTVPLEPGWGWPALDGYVEATAGSPPAVPCEARQDVDTDGSSRLIYYLIKGSRHRGWTASGRAGAWGREEAGWGDGRPEQDSTLDSGAGHTEESGVSLSFSGQQPAFSTTNEPAGRGEALLLCGAARGTSRLDVTPPETCTPPCC
ncbi:hypothetical protein BU61_9321 [Pontoporia blainvillei]|uniref:Uncharacterized protein n=1 Tax=Pontoporia blainvillei TaxID=48723 RepID=A0ABX0S8P7_PONBL|nr:hypothetical protein [Pontoporia blainvillei]